MWAMNETWGIPGPTFLWLFIGACVAVVIGTFAIRRRLLAGTPAGPTADLPAAHLAYLADSPARAVEASLIFLTRAGAIDVDPDTRRLNRLGGIPAGASALDSALLQAAGNHIRARDAREQAAVRAALDGIRQDLERRGLILSPAQRRQARFPGWLLLGLVLIGLARLLAGATDGKPVGYLILVLLALVPFTLWALLSRPWITRSGQDLLSAQRRRHEHLRQSYQPAWQTYEPAMVAAAVGLFGTAVLWDADPALATALESQLRGAGRPGADGHSGYSCSSGSSGDGGSSGGDGGGGGCGGGGCGG